jgi:Spy/CpxP family protein refolding chaperone
MRQILLAAAVLGTVTAFGAAAAPVAPGIHVSPMQPLVTQADWHWSHGHWGHHHWRRWWHGEWRYR